MDTIGERIKAARKRARLSQEALARRAGMSTNGVARIEQGGISDPHYSTLVGIAGALDVSIGELLSEEPALSGKGRAPTNTGRPGAASDEEGQREPGEPQVVRGSAQIRPRVTVDVEAIVREVVREVIGRARAGEDPDTLEREATERISERLAA